MKKRLRFIALFFSVFLILFSFPAGVYAGQEPLEQTAFSPEDQILTETAESSEISESSSPVSVPESSEAISESVISEEESSLSSEPAAPDREESFDRYPYYSKQESSEIQASSELPISPNDAWDEEDDVTLSLACDWLTNFGQGELYYLCMGAAGVPAPAKTVTKYIADVSLTASFEDILSLEYTVLNTTFCGYSAENVLGKNLISEIGRYEYYDIENLQTVAYALLALDSNRYMKDGSEANNRTTLIEQLLKYQNTDGGFSAELGGSSSPVQTALALTALSPYAEEKKFFQAVQNGLEYLQLQQRPDGTFLENREVSSVAVSKTITALISLGIPLTDPEFMKEGETLDQVLMRYVKVDGGFSGVIGQQSDIVATENAILAMIALKNQRNPYLLTTQLEPAGSSPESGLDGNDKFHSGGLLSKRNLFFLLAVIGVLLLILLLVRLFWRPEEDVQNDEGEDEWIEVDPEPPPEEKKS